MSANNWADDSDIEDGGMSFSRGDPRFVVEDRRAELARAAAQKKAAVVADKNEGWAADDSNWPAAHRGVGR